MYILHAFSYGYSSNKACSSMLEKLVHIYIYIYIYIVGILYSVFIVLFFSFFLSFFFFLFCSKNTHEMYNVEKKKARSFDNDLVYAVCSRPFFLDDRLRLVEATLVFSILGYCSFLLFLNFLRVSCMCVCVCIYMLP